MISTKKTAVKKKNVKRPVAITQSTQHYYTKNPTSKKITQNIEVVFMKRRYSFETASSTFSQDRLDRGSEVMLLNVLPLLKDNQQVLDLGCGWGAVAIILKTLRPSLHLVASDINERAVEQCVRNAKKNHVEIDVRSSDGFEHIAESFNFILLNPPQTAGKAICFRLIEESRMHLLIGGTLILVARTQKGGKTLAAHMEKIFGNVKTIGRGSGFSVYASHV